MWRLHIALNGRETGVFECPAGKEMVIGRDPTADIVVPERSVSRRHCRVVGVAEGIDVLDLGSANGVYSSGRPVQRIKLAEGEEVQIGMAYLRVSKAANRTGMIPVQGFEETVPGRPGDDPSTSSSTMLRFVKLGSSNNAS